LDLNGSEWLLGEAPDDADPPHARWSELERVTEWLPATVPGNVQADLVDAGRLPDPNSAYDAALLRRAGERSWWLVRRFAAGCSPSDHAHLETQPESGLSQAD
jgi:beta-mannosidase